MRRCDDHLNLPNTSRSSTPSGCWRRASRLRWAAPATVMTKLSPRRSNRLYQDETSPRRGPWRSLEAVEFATLEWVDCFNNWRLLEPIGNIPPAEAKERYYAMLAPPAMA